MAYGDQVPSEMRATALAVIGRRGDVGAMTQLVPLRNRPDPVLQPAAVAAIMALEARRNAGATAMMKAAGALALAQHVVEDRFEVGAPGREARVADLFPAGVLAVSGSGPATSAGECAHPLRRRR